MVDTDNALNVLSGLTAQLVERSASSVVAVHGGRRSSSGIHWRAGIVVTAEEVLERDEDIAVAFPDGRQVPAALVGRDPSTDVAVLRIQPDGLSIAQTVGAAPLQAGNIVLAIGKHDGLPLASFGIVAFVGGAWRSLRGGTIDSLLRLDLVLDPTAEGGAVVDVHGQVLGMAVSAPRRRVLAIPASTIDRAVDQLLAKGYVGRGYLGASLQNVRVRGQAGSEPDRAVLIVNIDPEGPAARAGLLVGDIITAWDSKLVKRVRDVVGFLGAESIGGTVTFDVIRGGARMAFAAVIDERPLT
jgi:S1-C subfamily serine protease